MEIGPRAWFLAFRPKTLTAAIAPIWVGSALAVGFAKTWSGAVVFWALFVSLCLQIGTNLINDAIDFEKGTDTEKRLGPKRASQSGWIAPRQVYLVGLIFFALAFVGGLPLVARGGWPILMVGVFSILCGYFYTGGPFPLAYHGWGDFFVIVFFGLISVAGISFLHGGFLPPVALVAGLQVGLLATALIAVNNYRDAPLDHLTGKRTLAVRLGARGALIEITACVLLPFLVGAFWLRQESSWAFLLPLLALPFALRIVRGLWREFAPGEHCNRALAQAAFLHLLFSFLLGLGLCLRA